MWFIQMLMTKKPAHTRPGFLILTEND